MNLIRHLTPCNAFYQILFQNYYFNYPKMILTSSNNLTMSFIDIVNNWHSHDISYHHNDVEMFYFVTTGLALPKTSSLTHHNDVEMFYFDTTGLALPKTSSLTHHIDREMTFMWDSGLLEVWEAKWKPRRPTNCKKGVLVPEYTSTQNARSDLLRSYNFDNLHSTTFIT